MKDNSGKEINDIEFLIGLPYSLKSWFILKDYVDKCNWPDVRVYEKIILDYHADCPIQEMVYILSTAQKRFTDDVVTRLFDLYLQLSLTE